MPGVPLIVLVVGLLSDSCSHPQGGSGTACRSGGRRARSVGSSFEGGAPSQVEKAGFISCQIDLLMSCREDAERHAKEAKYRAEEERVVKEVAERRAKLSCLNLV